MYIIEQVVREPTGLYPVDLSVDNKLILNGPASMSDAELLSVFITRKLSKSEKIELATKVLREFGSLAKLIHSDYDQVKPLNFVSKSGFAKLQAGIEIDRIRLFETCAKEDALTSPHHVREYLASKLSGHDEEQFVMIFLDNRHRVLSFRVMSIGTIDSAAVYPRSCVAACLSSGAAAVILGHNLVGG